MPQPSAPDLPVFGHAIPAYAVTLVVAAWVGLWTYWTKRKMAALESKFTQQGDTFRSSLRRQEEAFRLVHSPRVAAALKLWPAFCEFERTLRRLASPGRVVVEPPNATEEQRQEAHRAQLARERAEFGEAWSNLKVHHDEAEVLLPGDVFSAFDDLQQTLEKVYYRKRSADFIHQERSRERYEAESLGIIEALLTEADEKRPAVVAMLRRLVEGE
jgi:hypothetical protein